MATLTSTPVPPPGQSTGCYLSLSTLIVCAMKSIFEPMILSISNPLTYELVINVTVFFPLQTPGTVYAEIGLTNRRNTADQLPAVAKTVYTTVHFSTRPRSNEQSDSDSD